VKHAFVVVLAVIESALSALIAYLLILYAFGEVEGFALFFIDLGGLFVQLL
jgi:hypothetical protein